MTHCLNTLANLIQQYIWLAPVLALLGGLVTSFTPCSLSSVPMVIAYIGGSAKNDTKKAFRLSLTMAGGLALTFLIFGSLASVLGHYLHEIGAWWYGILGIIMVLMALQIWGVIRILPNHPHDHGTGEGHGEHGCECHVHHHHHEEEHHHPVDCQEGDGQCHCGSESNKKRVSWCAACGNGEWSGGFSLFYTGDDRVACDGGSGREDGLGDFSDGNVCDWAQCFTGYGGNELQCCGEMDV